MTSTRSPAEGLAGQWSRVVRRDVLVIGTGVAGLATTLGCAPRSVALVTKSGLNRGGSSVWAQGGVAAAVADDDSPRLHAHDTLEAGAGLAVPEVVRVLTEEGPERVRRLVELGVEFDRRADGDLALGREGAHSRRRILHAHGDSTGAEMVRGMVEAVRRAPEISLFEDTFVEELVVEGDRVVGAVCRDAEGWILFLARAVVIATGGLGQLYAHTTNPVEVTGDGIAMAARAGARLVDLEFVQFHPTALDVGEDPMPLVTEALRGEGAVLLNSAGERFMVDEHPLAELAPRDVVARAIWERREAGERVVLDTRRAVGEAFPERFPTVFQLSRRAGLDPRNEALPVRPAVHYYMGGIAVDDAGRSSLPGLWACGEASSTGVHGANRLASNSLLEALVFGARVAENLRLNLPAPVPERLVERLAPPATDSLSEDQQAAVVQTIRELMWQKVGLVRDAAGLRAALDELDALDRAHPHLSGEARSLLTLGRLIASAALQREESRGGHYRSDFPQADPAWRRRQFAHLGADGHAVVEEPARRVARAVS